MGVGEVRDGELMDEGKCGGAWGDGEQWMWWRGDEEENA